MFRKCALGALLTVLLAGCGFNPLEGLGGTADNPEVVQGLDLPAGTNAVLSVSSTAGAQRTTAEATQSAASLTYTVELDSAVIVLKDIKLHLAQDGEGEGEAGGGEDEGEAGGGQADPNGLLPEDTEADPWIADPNKVPDGKGTDLLEPQDLTTDVNPEPADPNSAADPNATDSLEPQPGLTDVNPTAQGGGDVAADPNEVAAGEDAEQTDEADGQHGSNKIKLEGPFLVDLIDETIVNLGFSNIDDDADGDGTKDIQDADDDGDGMADDVDSDDDGDGLPDEHDQVMGKSRVFDALELPPGTYRRIRFRMGKLHEKDAAEAGAEMIGYSIRASGTVNGLPFEYRGSFREDFEVRSKDGIVVEDGSVTSFLLKFDPLSWFAGIGAGAEPLAEGEVLMIGDGANKEIEKFIRRRIRETVKLARDANGNGHDDDDD